VNDLLSAPRYGEALPVLFSTIHYCLSIMNRQLASAEEQLVRQMLEQGNPEARAFLP
jgi:hypothetical protein